MGCVYTKGDLRRMLAVLAAIDEDGSATLVQIVARTGIDNKTVTALVEKAITQASVQVSKDGPVYRIQDWGPTIKKEGAFQALTGALNALKVSSTR